MEETGCTLKDLKFLCTQNPANGMSDCTLHVFAAKVNSENDIQDVDEVAYKQWMPISQVKELLKNNETKDGVSILAILFALHLLSVWSPEHNSGTFDKTSVFFPKP